MRRMNPYGHEDFGFARFQVFDPFEKAEIDRKLSQVVEYGLNQAGSTETLHLRNAEAKGKRALVSSPSTLPTLRGVGRTLFGNE